MRGNNAAILQPQDIVDNFPGIVWIKDQQLNYYACNHQLIKFTGLKNKDNIVGKSDFDLPWGKYAEYYRQGDDPILNGKSITYLHPMRFSSGKEGLILTRKTPIYNSLENIAGIMGFITYLPGTRKLELIRKLSFIDSSLQTSQEGQVQYILSDNFDDTRISKREAVCLFYLIRGKTAKEIALILGISKRTAEKHLESIRAKLNCGSKSEVFSKALELGFVNFLPNGTFIEKVIDDL